MRKILLLLALLSITLTTAQDYTKGKQLFNTHCASCHKMDKKLVGPALNTIVDRQGAEWTKSWIYNNVALRESGDDYANKIYEEYNQMAMPGYQFLKDEELDDIVEYLAQWQTKKDEALAAASTPAPSQGGQVVVANPETPTWLWILLIISGVIVAISIFAFNKGMQAIVAISTKSSATNAYLMKKVDMNIEEVNEEFDSFIEDEVSSRVNKKVKTLKKDLNDKLKGFK